MKSLGKIAVCLTVLILVLAVGFYSTASANECHLAASIGLDAKDSDPIKFGNMLIKFVLGVLKAMVNVFCKFAENLGFHC